MEAIKRLELEVKKHRTTIDDIQKHLKHEKSEFKRRVDLINLDTDGENDATNYGLVYEYSDRICRHIKAIKELQQLIFLKLELLLKHSDPLAKE